MTRIVISLLCLMVFATSALSADMRLLNVEGMPMITVTGMIEQGDEDKFEEIAKSVPVAVVTLNSNGGYVSNALAIGRSIAARGFSTGVAENETCTSACALIWLAGHRRYFYTASRIGFHAAYQGQGSMQVSGAANAIVGAYLAKLDLNQDVIVYATSADPSTLQWLTLADARRIGLPVDFIETPEETKMRRFLAFSSGGDPDELVSLPGGDAQATSPDRFTPDPKNWTVYQQSAMQGHNLDAPAMTSNQALCQMLCDNSRLCVAYTFTATTKACALKSSVGPMQRAKNSVSGIGKSQQSTGLVKPE